MTDPPIFADIGEANISLAPTSFKSNLGSDWHKSSTGNEFKLKFSDVHIESVAEPLVNFDGLSDFSEVVTNVVNTVAAVVRNRVESLVNGGDLYGVDQKLQAVINKVISLIPS